MTWTPKRQIISTAKFEGNLLTYIKANQAEAIKWANGGTDLKPFTFPDETTDKNKPNLPVVYVMDKEEVTNTDGNALVLVWTISFEVITGHTSATILKSLTSQYLDALKTLLQDIEETDLFAGITQDLDLDEGRPISNKVAEIGSNETETAYFQRFTINAQYKIFGREY